jgi:hypothetical protein
MWPFKRKKVNREPQYFEPSCSHCRSQHTRIIDYHGSDQPDYTKIWRGQRYITCKCLDCGRDFYIEEPREILINDSVGNSEIIDDEEELQAAEDALKRQIEEDGDRRCQ